MSPWVRLLTGMLLSLAAARGEEWFPFAIPVLADRAPAFDLSPLNEVPAGASGWLRVDGEKFTDARGREVRLFGVNLTAGACFPEPERAGPLARQLARFGCNIVRLHFLDNQWGPGTPTLVPESNQVARDGLRPEPLARLDRFVAELKKAGLRINLNLHVGRRYPGMKSPSARAPGTSRKWPSTRRGPAATTPRLASMRNLSWQRSGDRSGSAWHPKASPPPMARGWCCRCRQREPDHPPGRRHARGDGDAASVRQTPHRVRV